MWWRCCGGGVRAAALRWLLWSGLVLAVYGRTREYFLTAEEVEWDFAPGGRNLVDRRQEKDGMLRKDGADPFGRAFTNTANFRRPSRDANVFLKPGSDRIGRVYTKCVYKRYTDSTCSQEVEKPGWMGILGPTLRAETGDKMVIHFRNLCSRPFSVHPHGVMYHKDQEGALYIDGTSGADKRDDAVPPGGSYTYNWEIPESFGPAADDPTCLSWVYHSHVETARDTNAGLIGLLLTCKPGSLNDDNTRTDGQKDYAMLFKIFNEDLSWYNERNRKKCGNPAMCHKLAEDGDKDFAESNLLHSINGRVYGTLPHFEACHGELVTWHLVGMGTEVDLHTVLIHGQTLLYNNHRTESVGLFAAEFKTAVMVAQKPGRWLINCQVNDHYTAGMQAYLDVAQCGAASTPHVASKYRVFYVAAEEVTWNYAPSGQDKYNGGSLTEMGKESAVYYERSSQRIGGVYKKALFMDYSDGTFTQKKTRAPAEEHLGSLGPVIRTEVGETIIVVFRNLASRPYSMQVHGVVVTKGEEGASYNDTSRGETTADNSVAPGGVFVYFWYISPEAAPTATDPDCLTYFYHSGVNPVKDTNAGLAGPLIVCKKDSLNENHIPKNAGADFALMLTITDENLSWYLEENILAYTGNPESVDVDDEEFIESNKMRNINGRGYGNLEGLDLPQGARVGWHLFGMGTEADVHAVVFHGNTLMVHNSRRDTIPVFPGTTTTAIMIADNPGTFGLASRANADFLGGMTALYRVHGTGRPVHWSLSGKVRRYYIAAIETEWDYAPLKRDIVTGESLYSEDSPGYIFVRNKTGFIGSIYKKAVYREFTDGTFNTEKMRDENDRHLGILGPIIRAEVGDRVEFVFKNMASRPYTVHLHGVIAHDHDDSIASGQTFIYTWGIPEKAGPASGDPNCIMWPYYSHVNPVRDVQSGLVGPIVICNRGVLDDRNQRTDHINREMVLLFTVTNENQSWYIDENIRKYAPTRTDGDDPDFEQSNLMHGINGRIYGNNNGIVITDGDVVAWYILGLGTNLDIHTVHFHGQTLLHRQQVVNRVDVMEVFPGVSEALEMRADNPGTWLLHCHITDHLLAGMETTFTIRERPAPPPHTTTTNTAPPVTLRLWLPSICYNKAAWVFLRQRTPSKASILWSALCRRSSWSKNSTNRRATCLSDTDC